MAAVGKLYLLALLVSGAGFLGGLAMIREGFELRRQRQLMEDTPTEDVESVSVGTSELKGTAVPTDEHGTIPAPFTDEECLVADWKVEEYDEAGDSSGWRTKGESVDHVPFYVDDGTGKLLVRPDEAATFDIDETGEELRKVSAEETPPRPVREFLDRAETPGESNDPLVSSLDWGEQHGDRKYHQHLIRPGEEVYVLGTVQQRDGVRSADNAENLVVEKVPEDEGEREPIYLIADQPEGELVDTRQWVLWRLPVGALVTTLGFGGLVVLVGPWLGFDTWEWLVRAYVAIV